MAALLLLALGGTFGTGFAQDGGADGEAPTQEQPPSEAEPAPGQPGDAKRVPNDSELGRKLNPSGDPYTRVCDVGNGSAIVIFVRPNPDSAERTADDKPISDEYAEKGITPC